MTDIYFDVVYVGWALAFLIGQYKQEDTDIVIQLTEDQKNKIEDFNFIQQMERTKFLEGLYHEIKPKV